MTLKEDNKKPLIQKDCKKNEAINNFKLCLSQERKE